MLGPIPFPSFGTGVFATVCAAWCIYLYLEISKDWRVVVVEGDVGNFCLFSWTRREHFCGELGGLGWK